jgi:predicted PurR-regulated permease PerM
VSHREDPLLRTQKKPPNNFSPLDRERLFEIIFFVGYFFLLYQLFRVFAPFIAPLLVAAMLALAAFPFRQLVAGWTGSPNLAALLVTLSLMITVVVPLVWLTWVLSQEMSAAIPVVSAWLRGQQAGESSVIGAHLPPSLVGFWESISGFLEVFEFDFKAIALEAVQKIGSNATLIGTRMVREFFVLLFQLVVLLFALFLFLRDGPRIIARVVDFVPMDDDSKAVVLERLGRTLAAMLRGSIITAALQGALTGVGLAVFSVPYPVALGFAAAFLAVVPFIGAAIVWIPASIYLFLTDHSGAAIGLAVWGLVVVSLVDDILRPVLVGGHARLPATLIFLAVFGGFQVYGLVGGLIGPLLVACVFAFIRIYGERYTETVPRSTE